MVEDFSLEAARISSDFVERAVAAEKPFLLHMLGIPGAGKSTFLDIAARTWTENAQPAPILLGFDQIMKSLPSYQRLNNHVLGFERFERPARDLGYTILQGLIERRTSFFFDNGGSAANHPDILRRAHQEFGYRIILVSIKTSLDIARKRVDERVVLAGQHTPLHYLEERQLKLDNMINSYRAITPDFYEIINNGTDKGLFDQQCSDTAKVILRSLV